jgi:hypothetical protein
LGPSNSTTEGFFAQKMAEAIPPMTRREETTMMPRLPPRPFLASFAEVADSVYSWRGSMAKIFDLPCVRKGREKMRERIDVQERFWRESGGVQRVQALRSCKRTLLSLCTERRGKGAGE